MSTVEAIQAELVGFGFILLPGTPEDPPKFFDCEWLKKEEPRVFDKPNPNGPVFKYEKHNQSLRWYLVAESFQAVPAPKKSDTLNP